VTSADLERAWQVLATVPDPEIPVISIVELGVVRDVRMTGEFLVVDITPTYAGCPAIEQMRSDAQQALQAAGFAVTINTVLSPAWSSRWLGKAAREKLLAYGIAPPHTLPQDGAQPLQFHVPSDYKPPCPQCASRNTERLSEFGSTACKALYRCMNCREPFDYFKPY
jgi:ring-1,2-phenylacetyl-CoA epoxidase subunit PaaD